jgi:DNA-binding Lrp family transcriptional regulator
MMSASRARDALLAALIDDGRASVEALGRATGLSASRVRQVLGELDENHVSVRGIIHPSVFGQRALAHLQVMPAGSATAVLHQLAANPAIPYVTRVSGEFGVSAEVRVRDRTQLSTIIDGVRDLASVARVDVDEYLDVVKDAMVRLRPVEDAQLDAVDRILLARLQANGRESYASLARHVSLTTASARARVLRLLEAGVVRIGVRQRSRHDSLQVGFRVVSTRRDEVTEALLPRPAVEYLAASVGRSSFVGTLRVPTLEAAAAELDAIESIDGVTQTHSWMHLAVVKEQYDTQVIPEGNEIGR